MTQVGSTSPSLKATPSSTANKSQSSEQARNRENQRRLRERRKGYTEELERKLRAFEREGVHATEAVQKAARLVVEENRVLRQLLSSQGVSTTTIEDYIRHASSAKESNPQAVQRKQKPGAPVQTLSSSLSVSSQVLHPSMHGRQHLLQPHCGYEASREANVSLSRLREDVLRKTSFAAPPSTGSGCTSLVATPVTIGLAERTTHTARPETRKSTHVDEMDCEQAARIITSLRGGQDPEDVWPELGCSHTNRTSIKNALLMSLAGQSR